MGASIFIMIWFMLHQVFLYSGVQGQEDVPCIGNYEQLKAALRNNTDNVKKLLNTFYPINKKPVHFVTITYSLNDNSTSNQPPELLEKMSQQNHTFYWAVNSLMLTYGPDLLSALALNVVTFNSAEVTLDIDPPFCANDTDTITELLETLTSWVSIYL